MEYEREDPGLVSRGGTEAFLQDLVHDWCLGHRLVSWVRMSNQSFSIRGLRRLFTKSSKRTHKNANSDRMLAALILCYNSNGLASSMFSSNFIHDCRKSIQRFGFFFKSCISLLSNVVELQKSIED